MGPTLLIAPPTQAQTVALERARAEWEQDVQAKFDTQVCFASREPYTPDCPPNAGADRGPGARARSMGARRPGQVRHSGYEP